VRRGAGRRPQAGAPPHGQRPPAGVHRDHRSRGAGGVVLGAAPRGAASLKVRPMARIVWFLVIALVVYVFGSAAWKATQTALKPQHVTHSEF